MQWEGNAKAAAGIAARQKVGSVGVLLDHRPPAQVRDHIRDNVRQLRAKEKQLRAHRDHAAAAAEQLRSFKLREFANVPSRLRETSRSRISAEEQQTPCRAEREPTTPSRTSWSSSTRISSTPASSRLSDTPDSKRGSCRFDPPTRNALKGWLTTSPSSPKGSSGWLAASPSSPGSGLTCSPSSPAAGDHQEGAEDDGFDLHEFERVAHRLGQPRATVSGRQDLGLRMEAAAVPAIPSGFRLMPEDERAETLAVLEQKLADLNWSYERLPLRIETPGQRQQQRALREKIAEAEAAVQLFSRAGLLVEL